MESYRSNDMLGDIDAAVDAALLLSKSPSLSSGTPLPSSTINFPIANSNVWPSGSDNVDDGFIPWDCIDTLVRGAPLLKFGRQGEPHFRDFQLSLDVQCLTWASTKKAGADTRIRLANCMLAEGQQTDVFKRQPRPDLSDVCWSLIYDDPQRRGHTRTLDVACKDRREYEVWVTALSYLIRAQPPDALLDARRRVLWSDVEEIGGKRSAATNLRITQALKKKIRDHNDVYAWGRSPFGELGLGDEVMHPEPSLVHPLLGKAIRSISCGTAHCIALADTGEAYAWGNGSCGRLGTGGTDHELTPRLLVAHVQSGSSGRNVKISRPGSAGNSGSTGTTRREPYRFRAVACGDMHSVAVGLDGKAYSWGNGYNGAIGMCQREDVLLPTLVPAFVAVVSEIASQRAMTFSAGHRNTSASIAFAANQLSTADDASDVAASGFINRPSVSHSISLSQNQQESLSDVISAQQSLHNRYGHYAHAHLAACTPSIVSVGAGAGYSAFVDNHGRLFTCGLIDAPLGHDVAALSRILQPPTTPSSSPARILRRENGAGHDNADPSRRSIGARSVADVVGIESASHNGSPSPSLSMTPGAVSSGSSHNAGADAGGTGAHDHQGSESHFNHINDDILDVADSALLSYAGGGATTAASDLLVPLQVCAGFDPTREQAISIGCGDLHIVMAGSSGSAYSWGWGGTGALGHGDSADRSIPTRILGLPRDVLQVACGAAHTLAIVEHRNSGSRELYAFGSAALGQVPAPVDATGTPAKSITLPRLVDIPVPPPSGAVPDERPPIPRFVAAGAFHSAVITSDDELYVCGSGVAGELGLTTATVQDAWKAVQKNRAGAIRRTNTMTAITNRIKSIRVGSSSGALGGSGTINERTALMLDTINENSGSASRFAEDQGVKRRSMSMADTMMKGNSRGSTESDTPATTAASSTSASRASTAESASARASVASSLTPSTGPIGRGRNRASFAELPSASASKAQRQSTAFAAPPLQPAGSAATGTPAAPGAASKEVDAVRASSASTRVPELTASLPGDVASRGSATTAAAPQLQSQAPSSSPAFDDMRPRSVTMGHLYFGSRGRTKSKSGRRLAPGQSGDSSTGPRDGEVAGPQSTWMESYGYFSDNNSSDSEDSDGSFDEDDGADADAGTNTGDRATSNSNSPARGAAPLSSADSASAAAAAHVSSPSTPGRLRSKSAAAVAASRRRMSRAGPGFGAGGGGAGGAALRAEHELDIHRPPSPTRVAEYRSAAYRGGSGNAAGPSVSQATTSGGGKGPAGGKASADDIVDKREKQSAEAVDGSSKQNIAASSLMVDAAATAAPSALQSATASPPNSSASSAAAASGPGRGNRVAALLRRPTATTAVTTANSGAGSQTDLNSPAHTVAAVNSSNQSATAISSSQPSAPSGSSGSAAESTPLRDTLQYGFLPIPALQRKDVRSVSCGNGFTIATIASEWMRNDQATFCMRCNLPFIVTRRKHHCRHCGGVFCDSCSSKRIPLLKLGYIEPVRVCDGCHARQMSDA